MRFQNLVLESIDYFIPDQIFSSEAIELELSSVYERLRLPHGRLELMTGIKERRHWDAGTKPSSISSAAATKLLDKNLFKREEVDLLIHSSVCRDFLEPSTASVVHQNLGLSPHCQIFDLSNACLGMMNAVLVAGAMIESGQIKRALIVSGENGGPLLKETLKLIKNDPNLDRKSIKKYFANLTIGSAGVAFSLTHKDLCPTGIQIVGGAVATDSEANKLCQGDGNPDSLIMQTDSEELLKAGIKLTGMNWEQTKRVLEITNDSVDWVIGHQVGEAHERLVLENLGLRSKKTHITYDHFGNTGSAAWALTLARLLEQNDRPKKDELMALIGIGSGLSSVMLGLKWNN